ncbi:rhamnulokinase [Adhaeretor mobilis]|uniref:Rhamnulokinase n=1 Tax=Adhaeretor mobilis TaxID=1930276 RepID=A0A517MQU0_9BACT|nr:rhamnulokinase family protein [Adhaeretor mobilis]QDS97244.1 Rhamnulokinase [Adhaeretor mobilis]
MSSPAHLAIDLGASSGRAIVGVLAGSPLKLQLEEVHRFEHSPCPTPTGPVWNLTGIWQHILTGLRAGAAWCKENDAELQSVGVDTWGVDWTLLGASGELLALPHCYRDPANDAACERVLEELGGFEPLYERTGIQLMPLNTIFQLAARHAAEPRLFDAASRLVFLPDLFHYWLSGELSCERTIASTSSLLAVESGEWDTSLIEQLGLPSELFAPLIEPGTKLGTLRAEIAKETGTAANVQVVLPASHDTGSAIAAVPAVGDASWGYLSSGTWSLLGVERDTPVYSTAAREAPFTNERGAQRTIRLLKNIAGLWLIQELKRDLEKEGQQASFAHLVKEAEAAEPGRTIINPDRAEFAAPGDMRAKIRQFALETKQEVPETTGQYARCCLESLALCYGRTIGQLEGVLGESLDVLHIVGGGIQNTLLNRMAAEVVSKPVVTGPVEATAVGNLMVQAMGCGEVGNLSEVRQTVARSFDLETIEPTQTARWEPFRDRFVELVSA